MRAIGRGGMATVYLAEQEIFEREVALKVMARSLAEDPSFGQRFFREAKIVSRLVHPNIVTVHDVGEYEGHFYLSMEYIDGGDLKLARKRLTFRQKINAIKDIAKALQYAATKGYVHRDIKPENIMFHLSDGRAVLTDFGIARAAEAELSVTQTGVAIGTPHYMSPEQAKGQAVDGRADIYSLGVVLYLLLAGKVPYDAESAVAIGIKHITDPIPLLPMELNDMQPIIDRMMAKSPDQRYQTAASLITALDNLDMAPIEKRALEFDRKLREQETRSDPESETPTLVSSQVKAISKTPTHQNTQPGTQQAIGQTPRPASAKTRTPPPVAREKPTPTEKVQTGADSPGGKIEPVLELKERFTVIYDNEELSSLDSGGSWWGAWLVGILILGAFGGSVYFYLNPEEWKVFVDKSQMVYQQTKEQVQQLLDNQEAVQPDTQQESGQPAQVSADSTVKESRVKESAVTEGAAKENFPVAAKTGANDTAPAQNTAAKNETVATSAATASVAKTAGAEPASSTTDPTVVAAPGEASENTSTAPTEEELRALAVEEKRARVRTLEEAFAKDAAFLPDLVGAHRDVLQLLPKDKSSLRKLAELEASEKEKIQQLINEKKFPVAQKKLAQLTTLFSDTDKQDYDKLAAVLAREERYDQLLAKADALFAKGSILAPENENALAVYKQVQQADPKNTGAANGIRKVSDYYLRQASEAFAKEDIDIATEKVKVALEVDWKNTQAEKLLENIRDLQERLAKRDLLFLQAEQALTQQQYFDPTKANAYHFYASILAESPDNTRALEGVTETVKAFSKWVWQLVDDNKFDEAKAALVTPLNILPQDPQIQALAKEIDKVIKEYAVANQPAITKILISGLELNDLSSAQSDSITVKKSIYVIFGFENISADTGTVEARLLDGAGNIELAKTTVNTSAGTSGAGNTAKFRFDSPVGTFPSGLYTLVVNLNGTTLKSTVFAVK